MKSFLFTLVALLGVSFSLSAKPLKVYLLVGQSNMQGHAAERTLAHLGMDPKTKPLLEAIQNADGTAKVHDRIWISSIDTSQESGVKEGEAHRRLRRGRTRAEDWPGADVRYHHAKARRRADPVDQNLVGWQVIEHGFPFAERRAVSIQPKQIENFKKRGQDLAEERRKRAERTGVFYRLMLEHTHKVLDNIKRVYPAYNAKASYELAGMVWFQGWNDMVDSGTYPTRGQPGSYDAYSKNLAHFIRDVRRDLEAPKLPFVIGVMGAGGPIAKYSPDQMRYAGIHGEFRKAMAAPTKLPEFKGNVTAVFTENYWDGQLSELVDRRGKINAKRRELAKDQSLTRAQRDKAIAEFTDEIYTREEQAILEAGVSNAAYHYLGSAKILTQIGQAFAEALVAME